MLTEDSPISHSLVAGEGISAFQLWGLQKERRQLRKAYLDHWQATSEGTGTGRPVDAIIAPCAPFAAPPHGCMRSVFSSCSGTAHSLTFVVRCFLGFRYSGYTHVWNGLDYPTCVFPVTRVDPSLDRKIPPHAFLSERDQTIYELCAFFPILYQWDIMLNALLCQCRRSGDVQERSSQPAADRAYARGGSCYYDDRDRGRYLEGSPGIGCLLTRLGIQCAVFGSIASHVHVQVFDGMLAIGSFASLAYVSRKSTTLSSES